MTARISCRLGLACVVIFTLGLGARADAGVILPVLDPVPLDDSGFSVNADSEAQIRFDNELAIGVDIYWIDYSGDRVFYTSLASLSSYIQFTYLTHPWIVVEAGTGTLSEGSGVLLAGFLAQTESRWSTAPFEDFDIAKISGPAVPEPGTMLLLGSGLLGVVLRQRRA